MLARSPQNLRSQHLPFQFPGNKRAAFAFKLSAFLISGFSIPFLAAAFQLKKAGAA
ncbi:hypothetical protein F5J12DRAFT_792440 [Pisolithus orientalis]|uniref:uncharacterized protein n=1 Tax=Pisolithus orientalis TaxID=936130 RepID=UPI0022242A77|nr:uncharacterized protein F5J12DRAFT_792440 [Pisolithus orientalis]KAI6035289.1 hypothetical protein F5J12DRAFT_792440 [Pisolithus orientalis]